MAENPEKVLSLLLPPPEGTKVEDLLNKQPSSIAFCSREQGTSVNSSRGARKPVGQVKLDNQSRGRVSQNYRLSQARASTYQPRSSEFEQPNTHNSYRYVQQRSLVPSSVSRHSFHVNNSKHMGMKNGASKPPRNAFYNRNYFYNRHEGHEIKKEQIVPSHISVQAMKEEKHTRNTQQKDNRKAAAVSVSNTGIQPLLHDDDGFQAVSKKRNQRPPHEHKYKPGPGPSRSGNFQKPSTGFKLIEELCMKEPAEIIMLLASERSGFDGLLKRKLSNYEILKIVYVLSKLCDSAFEENKTVILSTSCQDHFINQILVLVSSLPIETDVKVIASINQFIKDLINFFTTIMKLLPMTACNCCEKIFAATTMSLKNLEQYKNMSLESELEKVDKLQRQLAEMISMQQSKINTHTLEVKHYQPPPDNFRGISLYPTPADVLGNETVFLRPNVISGAYQGVEHYLDVQFRLLREDFLNPLREGISIYMRSRNDARKMRQSNVRVYERVKFIGLDTSMNNVGMRISFDVNRRLRNINWELCQRFMTGSLLCFSGDIFKSVFFGTVLVRKNEDLIKGEVIISLATDCDLPPNIYINEFVMAECEVYFEPYYHVMKALQNMDVDNFPMKEYIVQAQTTSAPPQYVSSTSTDYKEILGESWPDASMLKLDDSQYQAYKTGLTREFVVIQGPPGTGKTYLGLKLATTLLKNSEAWNNAETNTPMLVVCYTNHALDQFLEGLLPITRKIVRVGGRSKSVALEEFNLSCKRRTLFRSDEKYYLLREEKRILENILKTIKSIEKSINNIERKDCIVSLKSLDYIIRQHRRQLEFENENMFLEWLIPEYGNYQNDTNLNNSETPYNSYYKDKSELNSCTLNEMASSSEKVIDGEVIFSKNQDDRHSEENESRNGTELDDFDFDIDVSRIDPSITFSLSIHDLHASLKRAKENLYLAVQEMEHTGNHNSCVWMFEEEIGILQYEMQYCMSQMGKKYICSKALIDNVKNGLNLWLLSQDERWSLYFYWTDLLKDNMKKKIDGLYEEFRRESLKYREVLQIEDLRIMKQSLVIGMTTSGAARLQHILQSLKSNIVIVEEAAEVMEPHIVVSLTKYCQHLILIGDHQQLRPNTADYGLAKNYHFDISLFERMVKNGVHCETLKVQHRMRPEIAKLIVPSIYPDLENHSSVLNFKNIRGVIKNVFFMTHNKPEENCADSSSRRNEHEAHFTLALCKYLLMQGYSSDKITILTTYTGQMFLMKNMKNRYIQEDVKITVVDNYQGEENDIILLSLVRSNNEGNIGFLKIENRVCVALSRARKGMFMIGNMDILAEGSKIWPHIKESLEEQGAIGTKMVLRCQIHPQQWSYVENSEDFRKNSPEGGCRLMCEVKLKCGHSCPRVCHIKDRDHEESKCVEPCNRVNCVFKHPCPKQCWEDCGDCQVPVVRDLPCGHIKELPCHVDHKTYNCKVEVDVVMPHCNHKVKKPCYVAIEKFKCTEMCEDRLPCGHSCEMKCHVLVDPDHLEYKCMKDCTKLNAQCSQSHKCRKRCHEPCGSCEFKIKKKLPNCDHIHEIFCSVDPVTVLCGRRCKTVLDCGHNCPLPCHQKCGQCQIIVKKTLPGCNHSVKTKCCEEPDPKMCNGPCVKILKCGHQCNTKCCNTCTTSCMVLVNSSTLPSCRHNVKIPCHLNQLSLPAESLELLSYCEEPCGKVLKCNHVCKGKCGECLQGRVHMPCKEKCGKTLICGHSCAVPCAENCPPCMKKCELVCQHSKCSNKCGVPCTRCKEHCKWKCVHSRCSKPCYEMCDREACTLPCEKLLKCNHPCIGFCGDPCPPLCRECDRDEVTEFLFGNEDEDDARFVYLVDCKHVIEARGLENWLQQSSDEIGMKTCPKCKTPIMKTMRFMNLIKKTLQDISKVKKKVFGEMKQIDQNRYKVQNDLLAMQHSILGLVDVRLSLRSPVCSIFKESKELSVYYNKLLDNLKDVKNKRKNILSKVDVETLTVRAQILQELVAVVMEARNYLSGEAQVILRKYMDMILAVSDRNAYAITAQEVHDLNYEIKRFQRMAQLCVIESSGSFSVLKNVEKIRNFHLAARGFIFSIKQFSDTVNTKTKIILEELNRELKTANIITDKERKDIVKAVGLRQGHWYKCPNGHVYVIANCGRPSQVGKCNECGAKIGGTSHVLTPGNQMDYSFLQ